MKEYFEEEFEGEIFEGQVIGKLVYEECHFKNCQFVGVTFQETILRDCTFQDCVWGLVKLNATRMQGVDFVDCKIMGTSFSEIHKMAPSITFSNSKVEMCNFESLDLQDFKMEGCKATDCIFWSCGLIEANFSNTILTGVQFERCNLSKADFRGAREYRFNPQDNQVKGAKFSQPDVLGLLHNLQIIVE